MYDKIKIFGDVGFIVNHLSMNGYNFDIIGQNIYVLSDETPYVKTILNDYGIIYAINKESRQIQTERGTLVISDYYENSEKAQNEGYSYTFTSDRLNADLYSVITDKDGYCREFVIVKRGGTV